MVCTLEILLSAQAVDQKPFCLNYFSRPPRIEPHLSSL